MRARATYQRRIDEVAALDGQANVEQVLGFLRHARLPLGFFGLWGPALSLSSLLLHFLGARGGTVLVTVPRGLPLQRWFAAAQVAEVGGGPGRFQQAPRRC